MCSSPSSRATRLVSTCTSALRDVLGREHVGFDDDLENSSRDTPGVESEMREGILLKPSPSCASTHQDCNIYSAATGKSIHEGL